MKTLFYRANTELFLMREKARELLKNKSGAAMIEYSILIALITAAVIALILAVGGKVTNAWTDLNNNWT